MRVLSFSGSVFSVMLLQPCPLCLTTYTVMGLPRRRRRPASVRHWLASRKRVVRSLVTSVPTECSWIHQAQLSPRETASIASLQACSRAKPSLTAGSTEAGTVPNFPVSYLITSGERIRDAATHLNGAASDCSYVSHHVELLGTHITEGRMAVHLGRQRSCQKGLQ